jgi:hypothetical protein
VRFSRRFIKGDTEKLRDAVLSLGYEYPGYHTVKNATKPWLPKFQPFNYYYDIDAWSQSTVKKDPMELYKRVRCNYVRQNRR